MTTLPTGETLPDYDDSPADGVDIAKIHQWLIDNRSWTGAAYREAQLVRDVLAALQAVGDAQLVKNGTYRLMRRDGADIERLAAWLTHNKLGGKIVEHGGSPVDAAIAVLTEVRDAVQQQLDQLLEGGVPQTERAAD